MDNNFQNEGSPERLLTAGEVAEVLNISRAYAYRLMQQGEIRTVMIGNARRVRPADLKVFIDDNVSSSPSQAFSAR